MNVGAGTFSVVTAYGSMCNKIFLVTCQTLGSYTKIAATEALHAVVAAHSGAGPALVCTGSPHLILGRHHPILRSVVEAGEILDSAIPGYTTPRICENQRCWYEKHRAWVKYASHVHQQSCRVCDHAPCAVARGLTANAAAVFRNTMHRHWDTCEDPHCHPASLSMVRYDQTLEMHIDAGGEITPELSHAIYHQLGRLARAGIMHGDLKAANIVLNADGTDPRIIDFSPGLIGDVEEHYQACGLLLMALCLRINTYHMFGGLDLFPDFGEFGPHYTPFDPVIGREVYEDVVGRIMDRAGGEPMFELASYIIDAYRPPGQDETEFRSVVARFMLD